MTTEWKVLTQVPIGADIQAVVDAITGVITAIDTVLKLIVAGLEIVKALAFTSLNVLKTIVQALLTLIQELIFDILEYNVAAALHVNLNWNPFWVYDKEKERDLRTGRLDPRLVDYAGDGQLPWSGTGLVGWLLEILASTKDPMDPFRPVTDENTSVYGVMIIKGVDNPSKLESDLNLNEWVQLFTNWNNISLDLSKLRYEPDAPSLSKLATAATVYALAPFYQMGPKEYRVLSLKNSIANPAVENYAMQFVPTPGAYPKWVSIPMAALVPPLQGLFANFQKTLGLLSFSDDLVDAISKLIEAIQGRLAALVEAVQQIQDALNLLIALAAFLTDSYIFCHQVPAGGMDAFVSDALSAEGIPYFGDAGVVVGLNLIATLPDSQAAIDKFLEFVGIQTSAYVTQTTVYSEALDQTFEELFP